MNRSTYRLIFILILGFASGLPLALTTSALQAWLTVDGIDTATIGFLSLVGLPYTFKFLWAPLMDRFEPPFLARRKGWLFTTQLLIAGTLFLMSALSPNQGIQAFALAAVLLAFLSASQDIVIDAYRTDVLPQSERGMGASFSVFGYRLAMILSGGIALVWADANSGNGWSWPHIYSVMGTIMAVLSLLSLAALPALEKSVSVAPASNAKQDLIGFASVVVTVIVGYQITNHGIAPLVQSLITESPDSKKWVDLVTLLLGIAVTLPSSWWVSQKFKYETLNRSLKNYFTIPGALGFLGFIILYKLGDAFAGALTTNFLLKGVGFSQAEIGVVNKVIGIWLTIVGAIAGGAIMVKLGLYRSLLLFGILQLLSNLGFWLVAISPMGSWGAMSIPAFDIVIVSLKEATNVDLLLLFAVAIENLTGGMGTAAFVAFLMALCNQKFTATQFALLSAFASIGRVWVGPLSGVLAVTIGWPSFFIFSTVMAVPGLLMLKKLKSNVLALEVPQGVNLADD